jgi:hypothetical protein
MHDGETVVGLGFAHRSLLGSEEFEHAVDVHVAEIA